MVYLLHRTSLHAQRKSALRRMSATSTLPATAGWRLTKLTFSSRDDRIRLHRSGTCLDVFAKGRESTSSAPTPAQAQMEAAGSGQGRGDQPRAGFQRQEAAGRSRMDPNR